MFLAYGKPADGLDVLKSADDSSKHPEIALAYMIEGW